MSAKDFSDGKRWSAAKAGWTVAAAKAAKCRAVSAVVPTASHSGGTSAVADKDARRGGSAGSCISIGCSVAAHKLL